MCTMQGEFALGGSGSWFYSDIFASVMKCIVQVVQGMYLIPLLEVNIVIFITTTVYARESKVRKCQVITTVW